MSVLDRRAQGQVRVDQVRARQGAQVGASRCQYRVGVVPALDGAHRHHGDAYLVADALGEGHLIHAAVLGLAIGRVAAARDVDQVDAHGLQGARDLDRVVSGQSVDALRHPVGGGDAHRERAPRGPDGAHRADHLERIAQARLERTAVLVRALVRGRREEAREQVAVRQVQLDQVEAGLEREPGRAHEVVVHVVHVGARHLARCRPAGPEGQRRGPHGLPGVVVLQRGIALPGQAARGLAPGVCELHADLRGAAGVHEVDDALPGVALRVVVEPRTAVGDTTGLRDVGHLGDHEPGATHRARPEVHQVPVVNDAVDRRVLAHGRDDHAVGQLELAQAQGREHGRRRVVGASGRGVPVARGALHQRGVAQREVVVGDALGARHQVVGELDRALAHVALGVLEPGQAGRRRLLCLDRVDAARVLVGGERARHVVEAVLDEGVLQGDGVLHRELGARADREVRRVHRVAQEHHLAMAPALAAHGGEGAPQGAVGQQLVPVEVVAEQLAHVGDRVLLTGLVEASLAPGLLAALDDEGREPGLEGVGVHAEQAVLVLAEDEGEGLELLGRAQPGEAAGAPLDARAHVLGKLLAQGAVDPVGGQDQVGVGELVQPGDLALELEFDAQLQAACLQQLQQSLARHAREAVAGRAHTLVADVGLDVAPVAELGADRGVALRVRVLEVAQGLVRENDAPAEGVVGPVALDDAHLDLGEALLDQDAEVEPGRPATNADDFHRGRSIAPRRGARASSVACRPGRRCSSPRAGPDGSGGRSERVRTGPGHSRSSRRRPAPSSAPGR